MDTRDFFPVNIEYAVLCLRNRWPEAMPICYMPNLLNTVEYNTVATSSGSRRP